MLLTLFGAPQAIGDVAPGSPASVEIAMFLAFRGSASLSELEDALWPRGIDPRERNERLRRAQWWLGLDGEGSPRLRSERGRLWLSPEVHTDWAVVVAGTSEESCAIVRHLLLLADSPWTPRPQQGYSWLAREPLTHRIEAYVADVCTVAAEQALGLGDSAQAMAIATAGLRVCSHSTPLWDVVEKATPPAERHLVRAARRQQSMCFIA